MIGLPDTQVAEAVMAYITAARWFAGKGRLAALRSLTPLPWLSDVSAFSAGQAPAVRVEIAQVEYPIQQDTSPASTAGKENGSREFYQLPTSYRPAAQPDLD